MTDRGNIIKIGENEYELILTTRATKEIAKRYGGLENLGDRLMKSENFEMALDEIIWLITLLANQGVMIYNLKNPNSKKPLLCENEVELLTSPFDLAEYKNAIMDSMHKGTKRNIESESDSISPLIETIMIGTFSNKAFSFTSDSIVIEDSKKEAYFNCGNRSCRAGGAERGGLFPHSACNQRRPRAGGGCLRR